MLALFIILIKKDKVQLFQALGPMLSYHHSIPSIILGRTGSEKLSNLSEGPRTVSKRWSWNQGRTSASLMCFSVTAHVPVALEHI